jgi:hypothetical protein
MFEYLAFRNMLWAFTKLPLWLFLGAIACLFYRAEPVSIHADKDRLNVLVRECLDANFSPIPSVMVYDRVSPEDRHKQHLYCFNKSLAQAQKEYAQVQSKK